MAAYVSRSLLMQMLMAVNLDCNGPNCDIMSQDAICYPFIPAPF